MCRFSNFFGYKSIEDMSHRHQNYQVVSCPKVQGREFRKQKRVKVAHVIIDCLIRVVYGRTKKCPL